MGTGANMSTAEKVAALSARRAELEALLAAKNEELYALCVQEVQLTGVVPPEAPLSPEAAPAELRERRTSVRSAASAAASDGDADQPAARRRAPAASTHEHKNLAHRLSTPSISGTSMRSAHSRSSRRVDHARSDVPPDTFSIPSSQTYPSLAPRRDPISICAPALTSAPVYRHHTLTTDYMNKIYYSGVPSEQQNTRLRETHFSSSHPDIPTHHTHAQLAPQPPIESRATPLLYQYASQLKAQSQHLSGIAHHHVQSKRREVGRRNTLQRTQTYHLTAHSDYPGHLNRPESSPHLRSHADGQPEREYVQRAYVPMNMSPPIRRPPPEEPREAFSPTSRRSPYPDRPKEKQWYETSLDSPTSLASPTEPLPRRSPGVKRSPSLGNSQAYEVMSMGAGSSVLKSPLAEPMPLESTRNCTVVEQGKWIPYREVTKPFEMSDFYKYSTKFRQANQKTNSNTLPSPTGSGFAVSPMQLPQHTPQEHWHSQNH